MKLVAYLRVSTDRQAEQGFGLDTQEKAIKEWANAKGHKIVGWYRDEGVSGNNGVESRDELPRALNALRAGEAEGMVTYSLDRLARRLEHQEGILAHAWDAGASVYSIGDGGEILKDDPDDPMRTAIRQMRGVFAQLERAMIVKRMKEGREAKAERAGENWREGYAHGAPPYGWQSEEGTLIPDPDEQKALRLMVQMREDGALLKDIAAALEDQGVPTRQASNRGHREQARWDPKTISRILKRADTLDGYVTPE